MIFAPNSTTSSPNHLDLLRHLIEAAALADQRTALKLAVLSRMTHAWVEPIIYAEVNLRRERSGRAFLRTIRNSKTKPPSFFAHYVKSLVICSDVESRLVVEILSICRGIVNFSYWAAPSRSVQQPNFLCILDLEKAGRGRPPNEVTPQRMSVLLHENHTYPLKPHFTLGFFSSVTHLSILNSWEEWTTWTHICSNAMPSLTHIKFDMNGQRSRPTCPNHMGIQNFGVDFTKSHDGWNESRVLTTPGSLWLDIKFSRVANTLSGVLNNCRALRVCILLLRFDADPTSTVKFITHFASQKLLGDRALGKRGVRSANEFDSRLVFAHEREPFRYSYAHSNHEMELWKSAETMVNSQRHIAGYMLLDCGT